MTVPNDPEPAAPAVLPGVDELVIENDAFLRRILESSSDCIKVLDLEGRVVFMSAGGMRVMEIDDFAPLAGCPWVDFWDSDKRSDVAAAIALARAGGLGRFQGWCKTGRGTLKWWDVQVTSIPGSDGRPQHLLSISRDITEFKRAEERQLLLVGEMNHRVQNLLTVVQAVVNQTLRESSGSFPEARRALEIRVRALADAHQMLLRNPREPADIVALFRGILAPHAPDGRGRFRLEGTPTTVTGAQAHGLILALNELATNAVKHGALSVADGAITVRWEAIDAPAEATRLRVVWEESGGPEVHPPKRRGFGTRLLQKSISDIDATIRLDYAISGLRCEIEMPAMPSEGLPPDPADENAIIV